MITSHVAGSTKKRTHGKPSSSKFWNQPLDPGRAGRWWQWVMRRSMTYHDMTLPVQVCPCNLPDRVWEASPGQAECTTPRPPGVWGTWRLGGWSLMMLQSTKGILGPKFYVYSARAETSHLHGNILRCHKWDFATNPWWFPLLNSKSHHCRHVQTHLVQPIGGSFSVSSRRRDRVGHRGALKTQDISKPCSSKKWSRGRLRHLLTLRQCLLATMPSCYYDAWWLSLDDGLQPVPTTEEGLSRRSSTFEGHSSSLFHCIIQCQLALYNPVERSSRLERCPLKILVRYDNIPLPLWQHPSSVVVTTLSVVVTNLSS